MTIPIRIVPIIPDAGCLFIENSTLFLKQSWAICNLNINMIIAG